MGAYSDLIILGGFAVALTGVGALIVRRDAKVRKANEAAAREGLPAVYERRTDEIQPARQERREPIRHGMG